MFLVSFCSGYAPNFGVEPMFVGKLVGASGFEPPTSWSRTRRSSQAEPRPEHLYITSFSLCYQHTSLFSEADRFPIGESWPPKLQVDYISERDGPITSDFS